MPKLRQHCLPALLLFVPVLRLFVGAQLLWDSSQEILSSSLPQPAICPSRSVNYITDSLPQQCLGAIWTARSGSINRVIDQRVTTTSIHPNPTSADKEAIPTTIPLQSGPEASPDIGGSISEELTSSEYLVSGSPSSLTAILPRQTGFAAEVDQGVDGDGDGDSPLDNAKFLSFEEWRKQNLAKAGQSVENVGGRTGVGESEPRRRPGSINNALDALGEDTEIEIDFSGFVSPERTSHAISLKEPISNDSQPNISSDKGEPNHKRDVSGSHPRSKDAGKTCKERFNYASFDCAATVLKTNKECTGSTSVLVENKDTYMLNKCSAENKFFIVELCDDILVDTIVLANFEFFSSMFRIFKVSVSDKYPVKLEKWREIGTFEAKNSREVQAFLVESPLIWARYLRVELLAHFGNEYYCPVSLIRVHGTTMMEEFNHDMKGLRGEEEAELENGEDEEILESDTGIIVADALQEEAQALVEEPDPTPHTSSTTTTPMISQTQSTALQKESASRSFSNAESFPLNFTFHEFLLSAKLEAIMLSLDERYLTCTLNDRFTNISSNIQSSTTTNHSKIEPRKNSKVLAPQHEESLSQDDPPSTQTSVTILNSTITNSPSRINNSSNVAETSNSSKVINQHSQSSTKTHTSSTQPPAANPTTQESFFKTIHKRLQLLESNSTLSLQYIEEQSRILRDAFSKVEKRQLAKTTTFLEGLNTTVLTELRGFRSQYDQLWQSTVLELSAQRESSRREVFALSARLSLLADEIVFQKRMAILQFVLILLCLGLIMFSRASSANLLGVSYPELSPLVQSATKSPANANRYAHFETPNTSPSSTRPSSRYGLFGRGLELARSLSEEPKTDIRDANEAKSPSIEYSPPTPNSSQDGAGSNSNIKDEVRFEGGSSSEAERDEDTGSRSSKQYQRDASPAAAVES